MTNDETVLKKSKRVEKKDKAPVKKQPRGATGGFKKWDHAPWAKRGVDDGKRSAK